MTLDLTSNYLLLQKEGDALVLDGGREFWTRPESDLERIGENWLVSEYEYAADWDNWEMHPHGDEVVYVLAGKASLILELPQGRQVVEISSPGAMVVPRGVWHTAKIHERCRILHLTLGKGTVHKAVESDVSP